MYSQVLFYMCKDCPDRDKCKRICKKIANLLRAKYGLRSNYLVKFVDPKILNAISPTPLIVKKKTPTERKMFKMLDIRVSRLSKKQRFCLCHYYGLQGKEAMSQYDIAKLLKLTRPAISYHLKKAKTFIRLSMLKSGKFHLPKLYINER